MDLRTLGENLEGGVYKTKDEFYSDTKLIFDNAVLFNKDSQSAFIIDLAKRLEDVFNQIRKIADGSATKKGKKTMTPSSSDREHFFSNACRRHDLVYTAPNSSSESQSDKVARWVRMTCYFTHSEGVSSPRAFIKREREEESLAEKCGNLDAVYMHPTQRETTEETMKRQEMINERCQQAGNKKRKARSNPQSGDPSQAKKKRRKQNDRGVSQYAERGATNNTTTTLAATATATASSDTLTQKEEQEKRQFLIYVKVLMK